MDSETTTTATTTMAPRSRMDNHYRRVNVNPNPIIKTIEDDAPLMTLPTAMNTLSITSTHSHHASSINTDDNDRPADVDVICNDNRGKVDDEDDDSGDSDSDCEEEEEEELLHRMQTIQTAHHHDDNIHINSNNTNAETNTNTNNNNEVSSHSNIGCNNDNDDDDDYSSTSTSSSSSSSQDGDSLDNSISLTDLNHVNVNHFNNNKSKSSDDLINSIIEGISSGAHPHCPNNENDDDDDNNGNTANYNPLPQPPRHFLCPIQNTLLCDPVIDREGHTYERDAILRWLVLTSQTFSSSGSSSSGCIEESSATLSNTNGGVDNTIDNGNNGNGESSSAFGMGTSPITGNPMSVEELVEDKVVKGAIERWRKECWVRFLLGNNNSINKLGCNNNDNREEVGDDIDNDNGNDKVQLLLEGSSDDTGVEGESSGNIDESGRSRNEVLDVVDVDVNGSEQRSGKSRESKIIERKNRRDNRSKKDGDVDGNKQSGRNRGSKIKIDSREKRNGKVGNDIIINDVSTGNTGNRKTTKIQGTLHDLHKLDNKKPPRQGRRISLGDNDGGMNDLIDKLKKGKSSSKSKRHNHNGAPTNNSHAGNKSGSRHKSHDASADNKEERVTISSSNNKHKEYKGSGHHHHRKQKNGSDKHHNHNNSGNSSSGKHKELKSKSPRHSTKKGVDPPAAAAVVGDPNVISPSPTKPQGQGPSHPQKGSMSKQHPPPYPPPPPKSSNKRRDRNGKSVSTSQRTAITSNTTPTNTHTNKPRHPSSASSIPAPPFASTSSQAHDHDHDSPAVPIKNIIQKNSTSNSSFCSNLSNPYDLFSLTTTTSMITNNQPRPQFNGWSVPLGVHKVICSAPGLKVTAQVHRRSMAVKVAGRNADVVVEVADNRRKGKGGEGKGKAGGGGTTTTGRKVRRELVIPPGSYVEILETQVHGERVRGRICWEEEEEEDDDESAKKKSNKKSIKKRTSRLLKRTSRKNKKRQKSAESNGGAVRKIVRYEGWISLQWAKSEEEKDAENDNEDEEEDVAEKEVRGMEGRVTDEDSGPWTEPVPLGVYRINFGGGLPLRETPERDSLVLSKLDRGRCVEVVQTQVKGDRVRARVIVPNVNVPRSDEDGNSSSGNNKGSGVKFTSGWISLLNALTGSSGASPVPLGAYVVVAEPGCVITEGGRLDSKIRGTLVPGSCMEVVATRMEEGVVRGLIDGGGHVTLFVPPGMSQEVRLSANSSTTSTSGSSSNGNTGGNGRKNADGGRMFAMPVPLGTYQIIQNALSVTAGISSTSTILMKLQLNATAEIIETRVEDGRVRGRICSVINEDGTRVVGYEKAGSSSGSAGEANGWINLFEPNMRWAKIVCFKGGRPVKSGGGQQRRGSSTLRGAPS